MWGFATRLARDPRAATAIEYGLVAALISVAIMGALISFASGAMDVWNTVATKFNTG
jgi:pilus assembly protein Flp/PilA